MHSTTFDINVQQKVTLNIGMSNKKIVKKCDFLVRGENRCPAQEILTAVIPAETSLLVMREKRQNKKIKGRCNNSADSVYI